MNRTVWGILFALSLAAVLAGIFWPRDLQVGFSCTFLRITGAPCPFCGMTRAFLAAGHGAWGEGIRQSPLGALLFPAVILFAVLSGWRWAFSASGANGSVPRIPRWAWISAAIVLAANWAYRLLAGLK